MIATYPGILFHRRESAARLAALAIGMLIVIGQSRLIIFPPLHKRETPIQVQLVEIPPPPAPPPPAPPPPVQPPPKPRQVITRKAPAKRVIAPAPKPVVQPPPPVQPVVPEPASVKAPPPVPAPQIVSNGESENEFSRSVRQRIEAHKVYPAEAQSLGMTGVVTLSYVIDRSGKLLKVEVITSSGSKLLDRAALQAVRATTFQPIPEDAWVDQKQKEFRTKIVFEIDS
ncbi:MAG: TonB family protein [Sideroxydans sp.]|nr:TonB family protein [Sideroxydans sp.]